MTQSLTLRVQNLSISIAGTDVVHDVSFEVAAGERVGIIGGSGSGKTLTALAIAGLLPDEATATGSVQIGQPDGTTTELLSLSEREFAKLRGDQIGMVFQEPKTALSPFQTLGTQMTDALALHYRLSRSERQAAAVRLATQVSLKDPARMVNAYPHEVSGGQRQRAAIAAAISASPGLLLADEPTTALDVSVQRGVLDLFNTIVDRGDCSLLCISHDIAAIQLVSDRILVFDAGRVVESGSTLEILERPAHAITRALIAAAGGAPA